MKIGQKSMGRLHKVYGYCGLFSVAARKMVCIATRKRVFELLYQWGFICQGFFIYPWLNQRFCLAKDWVGGGG